MIYKVTDPEFAPYGKVLEGYDTKELLNVLERVTPLPAGVEYVATQPELQALPVARVLSDHAYGGMPIQLGWCNGHNTRLNCLEYHKDSELNIGSRDFILLLAKESDIVDGRLDTAKVKRFYACAGQVVEVYATTLHYAPCSARPGEGFKVVIVLPDGTNGPRPEGAPLAGCCEDALLWARNKWLLAHPDSDEAAQGAAAVLDGENIDILQEL